MATVAALASIMFTPGLLLAQTDGPMRDTAGAHYFDFWPGTWIEMVDGKPDTSATTFAVRRWSDRPAFEEEWKLVYDGKDHHSIGLRAWDQTTERWMFTWVSDNGLFQVSCLSSK